jgi:hypothetical protein
MSETTGVTAEATNDTTQLLQQLLKKLDDMGNRERAMNARMETLEKSSVPGCAADAKADFTPTSTPAPTSEATNPHDRNTSKPRQSLPHPPMFSGSKSQWRGWKLEMEGKIEEDSQAIGSLKAQLRYIYMRLEGAAKTNVTTYYEMTLRQESPNPYGLLDRLEILYGERNRKQKAIQNLHSIRQREDETFISFYPRFEKEIANADAEGWDDSAKISYLRNALSNKMRDHLIGLSGSDVNTYNGFAQRCVDVSNDMELYGQWTRKRAAGNTFTLGHTSAAALTTLGANVAAHVDHGDMMEWEPTLSSSTQVNAVGIRSKSNMNGYPSKRPEDRELLGKRAKWVNQEEIDARRQDRRCLRCGRDNCRIATCPLAAALRPSYAGIKTAKSTAVTRVAVDDSDDAETEQ